MNNNERRFKYYDMSEEVFGSDKRFRSEPTIKIFDDPAYTIEDYYADCADVQLERMKDYGRGWYCYTTENENGEEVKRYVYVDKIEKRNQRGAWDYDVDRKEEFDAARCSGDFECHLQNTVKDRELFEIMVYDWKCDHEEDEIDEEEGDLVFEDEVEWYDDSYSEYGGYWVLSCHDNKYAYTLQENGWGDIIIVSEGPL